LLIALDRGSVAGRPVGNPGWGSARRPSLSTVVALLSWKPTDTGRVCAGRLAHRPLAG